MAACLAHVVGCAARPKLDYSLLLLSDEDVYEKKVGSGPTLPAAWAITTGAGSGRGRSTGTAPSEVVEDDPR